MARRHHYRRRQKDAHELDMTTVMNLMVVLVPFLLITAVFSRLTILELDLPGPAEPTSEQAPILNLEVIVRPGELQVADRGTGLLKAFPRTGDGSEIEAMTLFLRQEIKPRFPDATAVTILLEPDIRYDTVVRVMDAVRVHAEIVDGRMVQTDLFPDISIGDAPT